MNALSAEQDDDIQLFWLRLRGQKSWRKVCKNEAVIVLNAWCSAQWGRHFRGPYNEQAVAQSYNTYREVFDRDNFLWISHHLRIERLGYRPDHYYLSGNTQKSKQRN